MTDETDGLHRRKALQLGAALAAGAWVAPAILTTDAAAAQSAPPRRGTISGFALDCLGGRRPFATINVRGPAPSTTVVTLVANGLGFYTTGLILPGTYKVAQLFDPVGITVVLPPGGSLTVNVAPPC